MTVAVAWIRQVGPTEQLWFVSDSRLSGGRSIDYAPKIVPLSRKDSAVSFGGSTDVAFPLMMQLALAVEHYAPARERAIDIAELKTHTLKVFAHIFDKSVASDVVDLRSDPDAQFILGGYSWRRRKYLLWEIRYSVSERRFEAQPAKAFRYLQLPGKVVLTRDRKIVRRAQAHVAFAGDMGVEAERRLKALVTERHGDASEPVRLDLEPVEVVRDMLRAAGKYDSIGGAPQVVRIDQHINCRPVGVYWPRREGGSITLLGRPALPYENLDAWVLDPDALSLSHPRFAPVEVALAELEENPNSA